MLCEGGVSLSSNQLLELSSLGFVECNFSSLPPFFRTLRQDYKLCTLNGCRNKETEDQQVQCM